MTRYIIDAANKMTDLLEYDDNDRLSASGIASALGIGCQTLRKIWQEIQPGRRLARDLERIYSSGTATHELDQINQVLQGDLGNLLDTFVFLEQRALIEAGASKRTVRYLFGDLDSLKSELQVEMEHIRNPEDIWAGSIQQNRDPQRNPDPYHEPQQYPDRIRFRLDNLKTSVCRAAAECKNAEDAFEKKELGKRSVFGLGGAGIVALNGSADVASSLGLVPWMTTLSVAMGGAFIGKSLSS